VALEFWVGCLSRFGACLIVWSVLDRAPPTRPIGPVLPVIVEAAVRVSQDPATPVLDHLVSVGEGPKRAVPAAHSRALPDCSSDTYPTRGDEHEGL
jgi:hypothetical protein